MLPFGQFLRKKLNKLPQLWNNFIRDMIVAGPRLMVLNTYADYPEVHASSSRLVDLVIVISHA